jgi:PAS domain S-box-containing protein
MLATTRPDAKILIVDDQEINLRLLESTLKQGGYTHCRSLTDSRQTVAVFQEFQPDLILLDLIMPHLDGVAVMNQLRPWTEGTYLPILILTGDVTAASKRRALTAGAKDFLIKPLDTVEVLLRIRNLLETRFLYQQVQQRAQSRIQKQAALLDQANDAILIRDMEDRILFWNQGAERLYGWTKSEAVGRNAADLLFQGDPAESAEVNQKVLTEGKWGGELRQVTRDGRKIIVASRWTLVRDHDGRPKCQLNINTDITEKKTLEAQLVQSQRLETVGLLAGGVAHDFNNLLTVILGCSEVALNQLSPEQPTRDLVHEVYKAGQRAATLTRQLLAFGRKQVLTPIVLDLNTLVRDMQKMLGRLIGEDIALATTLDPALGQVKADPAQLEQILMNLAVNARDAMPAGGHLTIETRNMDQTPADAPHHEAGPTSWVMLAVSDTGCGMDEATKARVFEPFFTTKEIGKGTGLGLATVYGIVKQSGGIIEVDSEPGQGTTLRIYLPRLSQKAAPANGPGSPFQVLPTGTGTVLLVEDEEAVRAMGSLALRSAGYTVLEARDGEEALGACQQYPQPIDLLVTDVVMPKISGRQLADRATATCPSIKVLYISGYTDDTMLRHGVRETGTAFLHKPFTPSVLVRKVHEVLGR